MNREDERRLYDHMQPEPKGPTPFDAYTYILKVEGRVYRPDQLFVSSLKHEKKTVKAWMSIVKHDAKLWAIARSQLEATHKESRQLVKTLSQFLS